MDWEGCVWGVDEGGVGEGGENGVLGKDGGVLGGVGVGEDENEGGVCGEGVLGEV